MKTYGLVLLSALLLAVAVPAPAAHAMEHSMAERGTVALTERELAQREAVKLDGEWAFYWQQLLAPDDWRRGGADTAAPQPAYVRVPGEWKRYAVDGAQLPNKGYATYRLLVRLPASYTSRTMALYMPSVATSYRLWIDGELKAEHGTVATDPAAMKPANYPEVVYFTPSRGEVELVVQVANFVQRKGGMWQAIRIGDERHMSELRMRSATKELFVTGSLLIMAFYHAGLFLYRRKDRSTLYFGGICLAVACRTLVLGETIAVYLFPRLPWEAAVKVEYISASFCICMLVLFVRAQYVPNDNRVVRRLSNAAAALYGLFVLATPARIYTETLFAYQLAIVLPSLLYVGFLYVRAVVRRTDGSLLNYIGFLGFGAAIVNDVLYYRNVLHTGDWIPFGLLFFLFTQSLNISGKFSRSFRQVESLSEQLQRINESLDATVRERTAELRVANDNLQAANAELTRMEEYRRRLLANISHEIGTPLTSIKGYVRAMLDGVVPNQDAKYTQLIYDKTLLFERMMDDLYELTKLETREIGLQLQTVEAVPFFRSLADKYAVELKRHGLNVVWQEPKTEAPSGFVAVLPLDPLRIEQVVSNLLSNALKFTAAEGTVTIGLDMRTDRFPDGEIAVRIADNGAGIPQGELDHLFERFYRGEESRRRNLSGSGLGLAICKEIVSGHGGTIAAESTVGEGSAFTFVLPASFRAQKFENGRRFI